MFKTRYIAFAMSLVTFLAAMATKTINEQQVNSKPKKNTIVSQEKTKEEKKIQEEVEEDTTLNEEKSNDTTEDETKSVEYTQNNSKSSVQHYEEQPSQNYSSASQPTQSAPQTEWGRLGISEYDYYNSPAPNEGEIAFREAESKCDSVATSITNTYGFVTHFGDVYSYSENYIGCWITVHLPDGRRMFYNEFISRANRGEF